LVYADDVTLLGDNIHVDITKKNTQTLIDASKEVGLEVNTEKTKYILLSRHQNVEKIVNLKIQQIFWKYGTVQIFGKDGNKQRLDSGDWIQIMLATI
jgi:adenine-specific DNA methylase